MKFTRQQKINIINDAIYRVTHCQDPMCIALESAIYKQTGLITCSRDLFLIFPKFNQLNYLWHNIFSLTVWYYALFKDLYWDNDDLTYPCKRRIKFLEYLKTTI